MYWRPGRINYANYTLQVARGCIVYAAAGHSARYSYVHNVETRLCSGHSLEYNHNIIKIVMFTHEEFLHIRIVTQNSYTWIYEWINQYKIKKMDYNEVNILKTLFFIMFVCLYTCMNWHGLHGVCFLCVPSLHSAASGDLLIASSLFKIFLKICYMPVWNPLNVSLLCVVVTTYGGYVMKSIGVRVLVLVSTFGIYYIS